MSEPTVAGLEEAIVLLDEVSEKSLTDWRDLSAGEMAETLWRAVSASSYEPRPFMPSLNRDDEDEELGTAIAPLDVVRLAQAIVAVLPSGFVSDSDGQHGRVLAEAIAAAYENTR